MPIKVFLNKYKVLKYVKSMCNHLGIRSNFYKFCYKLINSAQRIGLACQARELLNDRYSLKTIESQREAFHYILFLSDFTHPQSTRRKKKSHRRNRCKNVFSSLQLYTKVTWRALSQRKNRSAMRTCVAYEIELLFSVWCLIGFLLEELISDYH